jgi:hypothetical protein
VAAKIAFVTAGTMADVPGSPIPPGGVGIFRDPEDHGTLDVCPDGVSAASCSTGLARGAIFQSKAA